MTPALDERVEAPPTCRRCRRPATGWPLVPGDQCSPDTWARCIRSPFVVAAENDTEPGR